MRHRVALFISCLTDTFHPQVGVAVTKVLERLGCEVVFPAAQTCCGRPLHHNGFVADARDLARRWVEVFESTGPDTYIVTPSGSCCAMVREYYPRLFAEDTAWETDAATAIGRTYEFVEFLTKVMGVDLSPYELPKPTSATVHYECHLRALSMTSESETLLSNLGNLELRPLANADQCCGFGGTFSVNFPAVSAALVANKVAEIAATGAAVTICNDSGCALNIAGMCQRKNVPTRVRHIAEVIAEAMGLSVDGF